MKRTGALIGGETSKKEVITGLFDEDFFNRTGYMNQQSLVSDSTKSLQRATESENKKISESVWLPCIPSKDRILSRTITNKETGKLENQKFKLEGPEAKEQYNKILSAHSKYLSSVPIVEGRESISSQGDLSPQIMNTPNTSPSDTKSSLLGKFIKSITSCFSGNTGRG